MDSKENISLKLKANRARRLLIDAIHSAHSGHPGGSLSSCDIITYLYFSKMNIDPANPKMPERDRFVLSKGHCAPALYSVLALRGFFEEKELLTLRKSDSRLQGHPDMKGTPGIDMSTGSLGQGISASIGMALAGKISGQKYRVYCLLGDGEIEEGQVWEATMFAAHKKLDNLCLIVDNNRLQIDGNISEVCSPEPITDKFAAFGLNVITCDGHDFSDIERAFKLAEECKNRPSVIVAKTIKGKGISFMEDDYTWHGTAPNDEQYEKAIAELDAEYRQMEAI